jgi:hypothetical protein
MKSTELCLQDFDTRHYTLDFQGQSVTITKEQFDDGMWREIMPDQAPQSEKYECVMRLVAANPW